MKKGNDLPIPGKNRQKYPLHELAVGEYLEYDRESAAVRKFGVAADGYRSRGNVNIASRLRSSAQYYSRLHPDTSFIVRVDSAANVVRIWRTR